MWKVITIALHKHGLKYSERLFAEDPTGVGQDKAWQEYFSKCDDPTYLYVGICTKPAIGETFEWYIQQQSTPSNVINTK